MAIPARLLLLVVFLFFSALLFPYVASAADTDVDGMPDSWELLHGLQIGNAADAQMDADQDGIDNIGEYFGQTDPNNALDYPGRTQPETLLSVYYGNQGWAMNAVRALEAWHGRKNATVMLYTNWNPNQHYNLFKYQLPYIWQHGSVPIITWEPSNPTHADSPENIEALIANGQYDTYIKAWATDLKVFLAGDDGIYGNGDDRRVYISMGHEMNGFWYPWSADELEGESPDSYVKMWQRVGDLFDEIGFDKQHLQWMWTVNNADGSVYPAEDYYPGDDYVDWIGIDGYNWGGSTASNKWYSPDVVFGDMLQRMKKLANKPISFNEVSVFTDGSDVALTAKDLWIKELYVYARENGIGLVNWFNEDKSGYDWQMFAGVHGTAALNDGSKVFPNYRDAVNYTGVIEAAANNPQIITDALFQGRSYAIPDADKDGVPDSSDNCPTAANADQKDADADGMGDACDDSVSTPPSTDWTVIGTTPGSDYADIQAALDAGVTRLFVRNGTYSLSRSLTIRQPGTQLLGESKEQVVIQPDDNFCTDLLHIDADYVTVSDVTVKQHAHCKEAAVVSADHSHITLKNSVIYGSDKGFAVYFAGPEHTAGQQPIDFVEGNELDSHNQVVDNIIHSTFAGDVLSFSLQKNGIVRGNTLHGGLIALFMDRDVVCENNELINPVGQGIFLSLPSYNVAIRNNTIRSPQSSGIKVARQVDHNDAQGQTLTPVSHRSYGVRIENNVIENARLHALEVSHLRDSVVAGNQITSPDFSGIYVLRSDNLYIGHNTITDAAMVAAGQREKLYDWNTAWDSGIYLDAAVRGVLISTNVLNGDGHAMQRGIAINPYNAGNANNQIIWNQLLGDYQYERVHVGSGAVDANTQDANVTEPRAGQDVWLQVGLGKGTIQQAELNDCTDNCHVVQSTSKTWALSVKADPGYVFAGWLQPSACFDQTGICTATNGSDLDVVALFMAEQDFSPQPSQATPAILLPLYKYPAHWNPADYIWDDVAAAQSKVNITAIINPDNGPGASGTPNSDYQAGLKTLRDANVTLLGYVATCWANSAPTTSCYNTRTLTTMKQDIKAYADNFGVQGIFFDEAATGVSQIEAYRELSDYARSLGLLQIVVNPGVTPDEGYVSQERIANTAVTFESPYATWQQSSKPNDWTQTVAAHQSAALIYGVPESAMNAVIDEAVARNHGYVYVTDDGADGNPWDSLPAYWDGMLTYMAGLANDQDSDGIVDAKDNCPVNTNADQKDTDADGVGDVCDSTPTGDTDSDGVDNAVDNCPTLANADQKDTDNDGVGDVCDSTPTGDTDSDGVDNAVDNCPALANVDQKDTDNDGIGDVCDSTPTGDSDSDGVDNAVDNCPALANVDQKDTDNDGVGDVCDSTPTGDSDSDGVDNAVDNCPALANADQKDTDSDGIGDVCDSTPTGDSDSDGVDNAVDNCPALANADQKDTDNDGVGDVCDSTPTGDSDSDGVDNAVDNCPALANVDQKDTDNDGIGDVCDSTPTGADIIAPVVIAPAKVILDAKHYRTRFAVSAFGTAAASDERDGIIPARLTTINDEAPVYRNNGSQLLLKPGRHNFTWSATDAAGNTGTAVQQVDVLPRVSFSANQSIGEGQQVTVNVILNGDAPEYPVQVPFSLGGTATLGALGDYTLPDNRRIIEIAQPQNGAQPVGSVAVDVLDDGIAELTETVVFSLSETGLEQATLGSKRQHRLRILAQDVPPVIKQLRVEQVIEGDKRRSRRVYQDNGTVTVTAKAKDPNGAAVTYAWSSNTLTDIDSTNTSFEFDPAQVAIGKHEVILRVSDGVHTTTRTKRIRVKAGAVPPASLSGDENGNGIADHLEPAGLLANQLPVEGDNPLSTEPGLVFELGDMAANPDGAQDAQLSEADLRTYLEEQGRAYRSDAAYSAPMVLLDYTISNIELDESGVGISVPVFFSVSEALPANALVRKYHPQHGWSDFVEDTHNTIASLVSADGNCPTDDTVTYLTGLQTGATCIRLLIQDGGANDADGVINGVIEDPVAITQKLATNNTAAVNNVSGSGAVYVGGTAGGSGTLPWQFVLAFWGVWWLRMCCLRKKDRL